MQSGPHPSEGSGTRVLSASPSCGRSLASGCIMSISASATCGLSLALHSWCLLSLQGQWFYGAQGSLYSSVTSFSPSSWVVALFPPKITLWVGSQNNVNQRELFDPALISSQYPSPPALFPWVQSPKESCAQGHTMPTCDRSYRRGCCSRISEPGVPCCWCW